MLSMQYKMPPKWRLNACSLRGLLSSVQNTVCTRRSVTGAIVCWQRLRETTTQWQRAWWNWQRSYLLIVTDHSTATPRSFTCLCIICAHVRVFRVHIPVLKLCVELCQVPRRHRHRVKKGAIRLHWPSAVYSQPNLDGHLFNCSVRQYYSSIGLLQRCGAVHDNTVNNLTQ